MKDKQIEEILATMKQPGADGEFAFDEEEGDGDGDEDDDKTKGLGVIPEKWNVPQGAWGTREIRYYVKVPRGQNVQLLLYYDKWGSFSDTYYGDKTCQERARHDSAEDFCRLKARRCTVMAWIFILAYCFAIP